MLDFAVYVHYMPSRRLRRLDKPLFWPSNNSSEQKENRSAKASKETIDDGQITEPWLFEATSASASMNSRQSGSSFENRFRTSFTA